MEPLADQYAHPSDSDQDQRDSYALQKTAPMPKRLYRGRPGLIVLTALIVEFVVIAGGGNQSVSKRLDDYLANHPGAADYTTGAVRSGLTFHWRFTPANGEPTHLWAAQLAAIGTLFLLTGLLGWVVSRGSVTFGRVWVAVGAVVAAVTPFAVMVGNVIIVPNAPGPGESRLGQAVYGYVEYGPVIVAGATLGLITGLIAALLAVITRRPVALPVAVAATGNAPLNAYGVPTPGYEPPPWGEADAMPTAAIILPLEQLPANRGPLDHLGGAQASTPYVAPVPVPVGPFEPQPEVTTAESAAIDAPTQSMHIEMTQPEIVLAEDPAPDMAGGVGASGVEASGVEASGVAAAGVGAAAVAAAAPREEPAPTQPPIPPQELTQTLPPVPPEELTQTLPAVPPEDPTQPPQPPETIAQTQPPQPPERLPADDMDELELAEPESEPEPEPESAPSDRPEEPTGN